MGETHKDVLEPVVARYRDHNVLRFFRGDAAFADPRVCRYLEAEGEFSANERVLGPPDRWIGRVDGRTC